MEQEQEKEGRQKRGRKARDSREMGKKKEGEGVKYPDWESESLFTDNMIIYQKINGIYNSYKNNMSLAKAKDRNSDKDVKTCTEQPQIMQAKGKLEIKHK